MNNNTIAIRDNSIDIAKGIGIILVVIGHCVRYGTYPSIFIYSFHMPLFFILSGLCFRWNKHKEFLPFLSSRLKTLIVPAIIFSVYDIVMSQITIIPTIPWDNMLYVGFVRAKWFLGVLFVVEILFYCMLRFLGDKKHIQIIIIALGFLIGILLSKEQIKLPYSLCTVFSATSYYGIGYILIDKIKGKQIVFNAKCACTISILLLILCFAITGIVWPELGMAKNEISFRDIIPSLLGSFTVIFLSKTIHVYGGG